MELPTLKQHCQQFLLESEGLPLVKYLPKNKDGFCKVKLRHQNKTAMPFVGALNESLKGVVSVDNIFNRSLRANGYSGQQLQTNDLDLFYVFPIDGYRYVYNPSIQRHERELYESYNVLSQTESGLGIFQDLIKMVYRNDRLNEAISSGAEVLIYGIQAYYALRATIVSDYEAVYSANVNT